jgi:hypothetical protein
VRKLFEHRERLRIVAEISVSNAEQKTGLWIVRRGAVNIFEKLHGFLRAPRFQCAASLKERLLALSDQGKQERPTASQENGGNPAEFSPDRLAMASQSLTLTSKHGLGFAPRQQSDEILMNYAS